MNEEAKEEGTALLSMLRFGAGRPQPVQIKTLEDAWRVAGLIEAAKMVPDGMQGREQITLALLHGAEIGLPPMQSIQRIAIIGNRPALWGDGALAIVESSGLLEDINEWWDGEDDSHTAFCTVKRKGKQPKTSKFSVAEAKTAGLWDEEPAIRRKMKYDGWFKGKQYRAGDWAELPNDNPWFKYPDRMLQMRARGFRLRDSFSDVLGGLYLREELYGALIEHDPLEKPAPEARQAARRREEPPPPPLEPSEAEEPPAPPLSPTELQSAGERLSGEAGERPERALGDE